MKIEKHGQERLRVKMGVGDELRGVGGRSMEAAKCVRDIDCSFQCPSGRGVCVDKTHECFCLPREETQVEMESTTACAHDGGCN
ncbi:hypothetical protein NC651_038186 [Populus alba x Populus x berolinensis]|nr:hypothetical protein NC651_038186 [Populus alba x Populus x berolinensis]